MPRFPNPPGTRIPSNCRNFDGSPQKVDRLSAIVPEEVALEVDGGIDAETAPLCRESGANVFVAGSAIFEADEPAEAYRAIARSVGAE